MNPFDAFTIVAVDPASDEAGVAVASPGFAVGAVVPHVRARIGAVATQGLANPSAGPQGLDLLAQGFSPRRTVEKLIEADADRRLRQFAIVDRFGNAAAFTGLECRAYAGHQCGKFFAAAGARLTEKKSLQAIGSAFASAPGILADRMLAALAAAAKAGGGRKGARSAALLVARPRGGYGGTTDRHIDLRVDDAKDPLAELRRLLDLHKLHAFRPEGGDLVRIEGKVVNDVQKGLKKRKLYDGPVNGRPSPALFKALLAFHQEENVENRWSAEGVIDRTLLAMLKK